MFICQINKKPIFYIIKTEKKITHNIKMDKQQNLTDIFRRNLRFYRKKRKLSQEKLSELLDKNMNYINIIESGKSSPPLEMIEKISQILEIKPATLLEEKGCPENIILFDKDTFINSIVQEINSSIKKDFEIIISKKI